jgi:hypothetical protein
MIDNLRAFRGICFAIGLSIILWTIIGLAIGLAICYGTELPRTGQECPGQALHVRAWQDDHHVTPWDGWMYLPPGWTGSGGLGVPVTAVTSELGDAAIWLDARGTVVCFRRPSRIEP